MTSIDYARARRALMRRDPVIATLIRQHGECGLASAQRTDPFHALLHAIIAQQLSTKAARTIEGRFSALFDGNPTPAAVSRVSDEQLRAVGFSGQKVRYVRDLCGRILDRSLQLHALDAMTDDDVIQALTSVKGIGRWTAEMFLIFHLMRPNVLPLDDPGLISGISQNYFSGDPVSRSDAREVAVAWAPYCSVATWYIWRSLDPLPVAI